MSLFVEHQLCFACADKYPDWAYPNGRPVDGDYYGLCCACGEHGTEGVTVTGRINEITPHCICRERLRQGRILDALLALSVLVVVSGCGGSAFEGEIAGDVDAGDDVSALPADAGAGEELRADVVSLHDAGDGGRRDAGELVARCEDSTNRQKYVEAFGRYGYAFGRCSEPDAAAAKPCEAGLCCFDGWAAGFVCLPPQ